MKKILPLAICLVLSLLVVGITSFFENDNKTLAGNININTSINQKIVDKVPDAYEVVKLYHQGELLAYVNNYDSIKQFLDNEYVTRFQEYFPDTKLSLGESLYATTEITNQVYENVDQQIIDYIANNDLISVGTNKVDFSTKEGIYATIYVKNIEDLNWAKNMFLKNFVSQEALALFANKKTTPELQTYGRRELSVSILENITITKANASPSKIMTTKEEILDYLCYGDNTEREYYEVQVGDTVEGVGSLAPTLLTAQQVMSINNGKITNVNQVLTPGELLNVTYFTSPMNVVVEQEFITKETVYPEKTLYLDDPTLREGRSYVSQEYKEGLQNSKYIEKWVNGVLVSHELLSTQLVEKPQREIVYVGSKVVPGVGSGSFRWPIDNPTITCRWYCYSGHTALDMQNRYNMYGNIYAADRGTVVKSGYGAVSGYYVVIDHNNGLQTQYNHMNKPGFWPVGTNVNKGEVIGQIGRTGVTTGPHLHFVIMENYTRVNPCRYLGC